MKAGEYFLLNLIAISFSFVYFRHLTIINKVPYIFLEFFNRYSFFALMSILFLFSNSKILHYGVFSLFLFFYYLWSYSTISRRFDSIVRIMILSFGHDGRTYFSKFLMKRLVYVLLENLAFSMALFVLLTETFVYIRYFYAIASILLLLFSSIFRLVRVKLYE